MDDNEHQNILRTQARRFAQVISKLKSTSERRHAIIHDGWHQLLLDEARGGSGLSMKDFCTVVEEFAQEGVSRFAELAVTYKILGEANRIEAFENVCFADELQGNKERKIASLEIFDNDDGFVVSGSARVTCGQEEPQWSLAMGQHHDDPVLFMLNLRQAQMKLGEAVDGSRILHATFSNLTLSNDLVLARGAAAITISQELSEHLLLGRCAELQSCAKRLFAMTHEYLGARNQFGKPLSSFQVLQHKTVDVHIALELSNALLSQVADAYEPNNPDIRNAVIALCLQSSNAAMMTANWAIQMHGAIGFSDECSIAPFVKRIVQLSHGYGSVRDLRERLCNALMNSNHDSRLISIRRDTSSEGHLRADVCAFVNQVLPQHLRDLPTRPEPDQGRWWHKELHRKGMIAPAWSKENGGMGASPREQMIIAEELARAGAPEISAQAIYHIGPLIIRHGSAAQKSRHLPKMLSGDCIWCQGYSEPNAGSDLASIATTGAIKADRIVVNGQKIWVTGGHSADWMFALVRTDHDAKDRRAGISMLLIDMKSKGLEVRPIRTLAGDDEFSEIFLTDVEVPLENVLGEINGGWQLAHSVLEQERLNSASPRKVVVLFEKLLMLANSREQSSIDLLRVRLSELQADLLALGAAFESALQAHLEGRSDRGIGSLLKIANADLVQTVSEELMELAGEDGASSLQIDLGHRKVFPALSYLQARRATIHGGTSEIQKTIVAKRLLRM